MIIRSGFRGGLRGGYGLARPRIFAGPRRHGYAGVRRGPFIGGGYRPWGHRPFGARLAPWVHRPGFAGLRPWAGGRYLRPGFAGPRAPYLGRLAPWVHGRAYGRYAPLGGYARRRPWIFRRAPPSWIGRFLPGFSFDPGVPAPLPIDVAPPMPFAFAAPPPDDAGVAPPPPDAAASPPEGAGTAGGPDGGAPQSAAGAAPPDGAGAGPGGGADAPPEGAGGAAGGAPPAGELPPALFSEGQQVRIRWDGRSRPLDQPVPPGGGVYVVYRDGKPEAAHLTDDFRGDVAKRFADELAGEAEGEFGQGEFFLRRRRWGGGMGRRRRYARFGRLGGMHRFGRSGRIRLLRSLRQRLMSQNQQSDPQEDDDDQQGSPEE